MEPLDIYFRQFTQEQKANGLPLVVLRKYVAVFKCFKHLMPGITINSINRESVLNFYEKLWVKLRQTAIDKGQKVNSSAILCCREKLSAFFSWLIQRHIVKDNPFSSRPPGFNERLLTGITYEPSGVYDESGLEKIHKLRLQAACLKHRDDLFIKNDTTGNLIEQESEIRPEILINQLDRRFNSFFSMNDPVFFQSIGDYVKFILENRLLATIIKESIISSEKEAFEKLSEIIKGLEFFDYSKTGNILNNELQRFEKVRQNSLRGSWFNLELVYFIIFDNKGKVYIALQDDPLLLMDFCLLVCDLNRILSNSPGHYSVNFKRYDYDNDLIRVHHFLLDTLESKSKLQEEIIDSNQYLDYRFNSYGIPNGELIIKGFETVIFVKTPAVVMNFFYIHRELKDFYSYQNFNEYRGPEYKQLTSNEFRLIIDSINKRVNTSTSGLIKHLIIKRPNTTENKSTNYYRLNDKF